MYYLLLIVFIQSIAIYLDNKSHLLLLKKNKGTAQNFAKKGIYQLNTRIFLFLIPPLLGLLNTNMQKNTLILSLLYSSLASILITYQQFHNAKLTISNSSNQSYKKRIVNIFFIFGIIAMIFHLFIPFYLNIIAYFLPTNALWIVQLNPILSALSTIYMAFYFDPMLAKEIDSNEKKSYAMREFFQVRIYGRFLILIFSLILYMYL